MIDLERLRKLADQLPDGLRADWDGTNHYQLTVPIPIEHKDPLTCRERSNHFYLDVREAIAEEGDDVSASEQGCRLGLMLDIATEFKALVAEVERLNAQVDRMLTKWFEQPSPDTDE